MANDVIKKYSIEIEAITEKANDQINTLEKELNNLSKNKGLSAGLQSQIDKISESLNGLKGKLKSSVKDINTNLTSINTSLEKIDTEKMSKEFKDMQSSITSSIDSVKTDIQELQSFLKDPNVGKGFTAGIGKQFDDLKDTVLNTVNSLGLISKTLDKVLSGQLEFNSLESLEKSIVNSTNNINQALNQNQHILKKQIQKIKTIINDKELNLNDFSDQKFKLEYQFDSTDEMYEFIDALKYVVSEISKLPKDQKISLLSEEGTSFSFLKEYKNKAIDHIKKTHKDIEEQVDKMPKNIDTDIRFRIKLDEDVEGTATVDSIVRKVRSVIDTAQKELKKQKLDTVYIKTGLADDVSNIDFDDEELEQIEKASNKGKGLEKAIKIKTIADAKILKKSVNDAIVDLNKELKLPTAKKIEVEVVGKVNEDTVQESGEKIAMEIEDAQYRMKGMTLKGGNLTIDSASGIATESTLSDIRSILSQWNSTGIPGTQSKEFQQLLKTREKNAAVSSDFDKYFRNQFRNKSLTKEAKGINDITADSLSQIYHNMATKEELTALIKNSTLKKGGDEGRAALHSSDYYKKSFTYDGKKYAQFAPGKVLIKDWHKYLDDLFNKSFDPNSRESLFNVNKKIVPKLNEKGEQMLDAEGNIVTEEIKIKSALRVRREAIDQDNKRLRENLRLNGLEFKKEMKKDKNGVNKWTGKYTTDILNEKGTITSNEDILAKAQRATTNIKNEAKKDYEFHVAKKKELEEQRSIMQQIFILEQKRKLDGTLEKEDNDLLLRLKEELAPKAIEITDREKHDELVNKREELTNKLLTTGLSSNEFLELRSLDGQIESLFDRTKDLSQYVIQQLAIDTETGMSEIDKRIEEAEKNIQSVITTARSGIKQAANQFDDYFQSNATNILADGTLSKNQRLRLHYNNLYETDVVQNQAHYEWNEKEIERLKKENSYYEKFIVQGENGKSSIDNSALSKEDKNIYYRNQKRIKVLQTVNHLYAEQNNLVDDLIQGNKNLQKTEQKANITNLNVASADKEGYEKLVGRKNHINNELEKEAKIKGLKANTITDEDFINDLNDDELLEALSSLEQLNRALDKKKNLTDEEIEVLVQKELDDYVQFLRDTLEKEEKNLKSLEEKGSSRKQIQRQEEKIRYYSSALEQAENPSANYATQLSEAREELTKVNEKQDKIVENIKEELKLTDEQISLVQKLWSINDDIADVKSQIYEKDKLINSAVGEYAENGKVDEYQAEALELSRGLLFQELKEIQKNREDIISQLSSVDNANSLKQLGILDFSFEERNKLIAHSTAQSMSQAVDSLREKVGLNEEEFKTLKKILEIENQISEAQNNVNYQSFQKTIDEYEQIEKSIPKGSNTIGSLLQKVNNKTSKTKNEEDIEMVISNVVSEEVLRQGAQNVGNIALEKLKKDYDIAIQRKGKHDANISALEAQKEEAVKSLMPTVIKQIKQEIQHTIEVVKSNIAKGQNVSANNIKLVELEKTFNSAYELNKLAQERISSVILGGAHNIMDSIKESMPKDGTQVNYGVLSQDTLTELFNVLEEKEKISDAIFQIQAKSHGYYFKDDKDNWVDPRKEKKLKGYKLSLGSKNFDPFDTSLDQESTYEKKKAAIEQRYRSSENSATGTARKWLKLIKERVAAREEEKKQAIEQHEVEKKIVAERQKEVDLSKKSSEDRINQINQEYEENVKGIDKEIKSQERSIKKLKAKRDDSGQISKKDKSEEGKIENDLNSLKNNTIYGYVDFVNQEKQILSYREQRQKEILDKQKYLSEISDKESDTWASIKTYLERKPNMTDEQYAERQEKSRLAEVERTQKEINDLQNEHNSLYAEEEKKLDVIQEKNNAYLSSYAENNQFDLKADLNLLESLESEYTQLLNEYRSMSNQLGKYDSQVIKLEEKMNQARDKYLSASMGYLVSGGDYDKVSSNFGVLAKEQWDSLDEHQRLVEAKKINDQKIQELERQKEISESSKNILKNEKDRAIQQVEINQEIKKFQKGMTADQKRASLGVDQQLMKIYELEKELETIPDNTSKKYKEIQENIRIAKNELGLFREEAKNLGLTLSESTDRMYLGDANKDISLIDTPDRQYVENFNPKEYSTYDTSHTQVEEQNRFNEAKYAQYKYHSKVVEEIKAEEQAQKRLMNMWRTAGMSDEQAKIALKIKEVIGQHKNWNKLTEKQKKDFHSLYEEAKKLGLELNYSEKYPDKAYVKELVDYKEFAANPEQYATNKYLRGMLLNPNANTYDMNYIENYRGATESTLQNIQSILQKGVKVQVLDKKSKINLYEYKGLNPKVNIDADKPGYIPKKSYQSKGTFVADATKYVNYDKMSDEQKQIANKFAELKNNLWKDGQFNKDVKKELDELIKTVEKSGLTLSRNNKSVYLKDGASSSKGSKSKKTDNKKANTNANKDLKKKINSILNDAKASKEDKQNALDEAFSHGWILGYNEKTKVSYVGKANGSKTSLDYTKQFAKDNGLKFDESKIGEIKVEDKIQEKVKGTTAVVKQEAEKQEQIRQYTAKQLNSYINRSKTDEGKNKWRDVAKQQGFDLDDGLVADSDDSGLSEEQIQQATQAVTLLKEELKSLHQEAETLKAEGEDASDVEEKINKTTSSIQQIQTKLPEGTNVSEELAEGMKDTKPVQEAAKNLADTVEETVKNELGINSPSKVMKQLGIWTGQGFADGVMESSDSVKKAIHEMLASGKVTEDEVKKLIGWDGKMDDGKSMFDRRTKVGKQAWESLQGALSDKDLFKYQKQAKQDSILSLAKARKMVGESDLKVNDDELKSLGKKVGHQWQIAEDAVKEYIAKKKEALATGSDDSTTTSSTKKKPWEFDINSASLSKLSRKYKQGMKALDGDDEEAINEWNKVLPQIKARVDEIREAKLNELHVTEQITDSEKEAVEILAEKLKMQGALDISKTRTINNETLEEKISYNVKDAKGNTATFDKVGDSLVLRKSKDVIEENAKQLKKTMSDIGNVLDNNAIKEIYSYMDELLPKGEVQKVNELRDAYKQLAIVLSSFNEGKTDFSEDELIKIQEHINTIDRIKKTFSGEAISLGVISPEQAKNLQYGLKGIAQELEKVEISNVKFEKNNRSMTYQILDSNKMLNTYRITVSKTGEAFRELVKSEKYLNPFKRMLSGIGKKLGDVLSYTIASVSIHEIVNFVRQGLTIVREFDAAMTELYKVSNDSTEALNKFGKEAYNIAKRIGSTGVEVINSAADWARLGYSIKEAAKLAEDANIYANVGDMDIDTATEHMISSIKAWESEFSSATEASTAIVDRYNEVGNTYAITSAGIGEAMETSAAALKAGGNTLNESLGLITAGNIIQQDASTTASALKILSLRIRGSKAELEEMGEETDGLASSTSKLRDEIKGLTGVDIMLDENTYKSTAQIIQEIGAVWENLTDVSQAATLEKLAGKNRASTVAGLLENYETIADVIKTAEEAEGSAAEENKKYMESIQGHIDLLKNEWQSIWTSEITRNIVNKFLDIATAVLKIVDNIGLLNSALIGITGIFTAKKFLNKDKSGGRAKVCVYIRSQSSSNMPPNKLAER